MSLIYRGQAAQPSTFISSTAIDKKGCFLGQPFVIRSAQYKSHSTSPLMQYRGTSY